MSPDAARGRPAIVVSGLSKRYARYAQRRHFATLKSALVRGDLFRGLTEGDTLEEVGFAGTEVVVRPVVADGVPLGHPSGPFFQSPSLKYFNATRSWYSAVGTNSTEPLGLTTSAMAAWAAWKSPRALTPPVLNSPITAGILLLIPQGRITLGEGDGTGQTNTFSGPV